MRRILIDHARKAQYQKRGGRAIQVPLDETAAVTEARAAELLAVDEALERLTAMDARKGRIVELRFFGGLTEEETAEVMGISAPTVQREWRLERIVRKCLEKEPERRYQSARELLVDLKNHHRDSKSSVMTATQVTAPNWSRRWLLITIATALLALGGLALYLLLPRTQPKGEAIHSMAVLPFKSLVAESHDEALELGMADTLITRLSGIRQLIVRPVSAVRKYTGAEQSAVEAGKEQRVDAVLESHFQRSGDRIRVTARLVRVARINGLGREV